MLRSSDDIGDIVVAEHGGTPLLVRDLGQVNISTVPRQGLSDRMATMKSCRGSC